MAGEDYSVKTKVTADVSNFEKGMNKAEKSLKGFSDKLADSINRLGKKGLIGSVANVTLAMQGLTKSFGTVIKFAKDVGKAINECTEAYKGQVIAERALDTAIQNNPFISGASSDALKQFASEMQRVSNYGDEELIPMMTNLVSLGRTEAETMQIMSVAMDMSAGMGISLDTAITQLNATLNGNIGRLGQQNAELKDLTEVELRSGKAIEILGEKFKGLSGATADTSKQLQNIKGDFKEALGQFSLPSSDLWNRFWIGFYEKGIEAINKINSFIDAQTIGRRLAGDIADQMSKIDIGNKIGYSREVLKVISDEELNAVKTYLEGLRKLNIDQDILLKRVNAEKEAREQSAKETKKQAEEKAKIARAEEIATVQLKEQEKIEAQKTDWAGKLLDQRIEMLETEKDRAIGFAEEEGKETYSIWRDYNEKILELKLERLEKEKEKALAEEGLTAEDKIKIEEYYSGETKKVYNELGNYKKKKNEEEKEEEKKEEKSKFAIMLEYAKQYAQKIKQIFSKVVSTIKNVFSSAVNIFKKLFDFNIDDALNTILTFEDKILTFFVETLPKMPRFFESVIQSIMVLFQSLTKVIDVNSIADTIGFVVDGLLEMITNVSGMINNNSDKITKGFIKVVKTVIDGLSKWISNGGWKELLELVLTIQTSLEQAIAENIDDFAETIGKMLPDLVNTLIKSIVSASRTVAKIAKVILPLIAKIIIAIVKVITSNDVVKASIEAIEGLVEGLIPAIVEILVNALPRIIYFFLLKLPSYTPQLIVGIINGLVNAISNMDFSEIVVAFFEGLTDAFSSFGDTKGLGESIKKLFKKIFSFNFWIDTLGNLAGALAELIKGALTSLGNIFTGGSSGGGGDNREWYKKGIDPFNWFWHANGTNNASRGLSIVGEAGPELVKFRGGEQVLNNRNTNKALENMGGKTNNFNVTFNNLKDTSAFAMMNQLKQYNRQMAINGVI